MFDVSIFAHAPYQDENFKTSIDRARPRNVANLQTALKKMDAQYDLCHDTMAYGELHNFKSEPLAQIRQKSVTMSK
jgi:hypothetical protein